MLFSLFTSETKGFVKEGFTKVYSLSGHLTAAAEMVGVKPALELHPLTAKATNLAVAAIDEAKTILGIEAVVHCLRDLGGDRQHVKATLDSLRVASIVLPPPIESLLGSGAHGDGEAAGGSQAGADGGAPSSKRARRA